MICKTLLDDYIGNVLLVDPVSPEVNRGSFCYLSYIFYSAFKKQKTRVELLEEFAVSDFDDISWSGFDNIFIALWSYPQIEACLMLHKFLKGRAKFYGYYPLIEHLGLPAVHASNEFYRQGMANYPRCFEDFNYLLLSDCDKHIVDNSKQTAGGIEEKVYPMFTSYGCPQGCKFCPATTNCNKTRIELALPTVCDMLDYCYHRGYTQIHFTDEDFFFDVERAAHILQYAAKLGGFKFIALGTVQNVYKFIQHIETDVYTQEQKTEIWNTLALIEIGLETADSDLAKAMGKRGAETQNKTVLVAENSPVPILWLTMTFYPGDTIYSINKTGEFLKKYGLPIWELVDRIVTNGTWAGLGQFFQFYHGTGIQKFDGEVVSWRPMRLIPSYIPNSFLDSKFTINTRLWNLFQDDVKYWMYVYSIKEPEQWAHMVEASHKYSITYTVRALVGSYESYVPFTDNCIFAAIIARLGIIKAYF